MQNENLNMESEWRQLYYNEEEFFKKYYNVPFVKALATFFICFGIFLTIVSIKSVIQDFLVDYNLFKLPALILGPPFVFVGFVCIPKLIFDVTFNNHLNSLKKHKTLIKESICVDKTTSRTNHNSRTYTIYCYVDGSIIGITCNRHLWRYIKINDPIYLLKSEKSKTNYDLEIFPINYERILEQEKQQRRGMS